MSRGRNAAGSLGKTLEDAARVPLVEKESSRMAHDGARLPRETGEGQWTRRQLMQGLALGAAATAFGGIAAEAAQSGRRRMTPARRSRRCSNRSSATRPRSGCRSPRIWTASWSSTRGPAWPTRPRKKPVDGDTLFMLSSTTKGVTATCMHVFVEKHKLDYDMPIVKVWPEFGANGKEARDAAHGSAPPDRRAPDPGRLHAGLAGRLGPDVPRHRRPEADVSRSASARPTTR